MIEQDTWTAIERGVQQRVHVLEKFLSDVYDAGTVFEDGVIPRSVVTTSSHFHRISAGVQSPNGVRIHVAGIDLVRDAEGAFRVLEDNVRVPSGVSYVMTNRRAISAALSEAFTGHRIRPVGSCPRRLLAALRAGAPAGVEDPTVVVLTPRVFTGAYYEHALLARTMGIELLVEGRDLVCRRGRVMMRTTAGLEQVHVIYRRLDDLPDLIRYYLSEEPALANVDTWRLGEPEHRAEVLDRLDEMVLKPTGGCDPGTSTCGRSRSTTATRCGCCPAGSHGWRCRRAS